MDGLILIDKPRGVTSHDVVARIRRVLGQQKVGHFGTLDPLATGLLLIAAGTATRLFPYYSKEDKLYAGEIRLGFSTDTYDTEGRPTSPETSRVPGREVLAGAMNKLVGRLDQVPPAYSAKKVEGRPLYKWARAQKSVAAKPNPVVVYSFDLKDYVPPLISFETRCSSGTYVRSLAHDLGQMLGCGGHLAGLRRLAVGPFDISAAHSPDSLADLAGEARVGEFLLPLESLLPEYPKVILTESGSRKLQKGRTVLSEHTPKVIGLESSRPAAGRGEDIHRLFSPEGRFLALARPAKGCQGFIPILLLI
jgi:tRNA pseudouridine55 synthase